MKKKVLMAALLVAGMGMSSSNVLAQTNITENNNTGVANMHYLSLNYFTKMEATFIMTSLIAIIKAFLHTT